MSFARSSASKTARKSFSLSLRFPGLRAAHWTRERARSRSRPARFPARRSVAIVKWGSSSSAFAYEARASLWYIRRSSSSPFW